MFSSSSTWLGGAVLGSSVVALSRLDSSPIAVDVGDWAWLPGVRVPFARGSVELMDSCGSV